MTSLASPSLASRVEADPEAVWQDVDGKVMCLHLGSSQYFELNEVASRMWAELVEAEDVGSAKQRLLEAFDVDEATLEQDLLALVQQLVGAGLLRLRD